MLDVFERVQPRRAARPACTGSSTTPRPSAERNIDRIAALGGGIAIQHRMAYQGEYFVERYGAGAAEAHAAGQAHAGGRRAGAAAPTPRASPATTPGSALYWLVTGETVGGLRLYPQRNCLDRETALRL